MIDLRAFYQARNRRKIIVFDNVEDQKLYIDFSSVRGGKIIEELKDNISFFSPYEPTCQLFTGHIGCGKSTELLQLKLELEKENFYVVYFESSQDLEMADVDIGDFLLAVARHVSQSLVDIKLSEPAKLKELLKRKPQSSLTQIIDRVNDSSIEETLAPEITASGREQDVKHLLERLMRPDHKLIVIHGYSGVGKTSLVQAGLIPAIKQTNINTRGNIIPVFVRYYDNWINELHKALFSVLPATHENNKFTSDDILQTLQESCTCNFQIILIFDQFEEFLFKYNTYQRRRDFFSFLGACLNILSVKVILSLRKEYLHYLLECIQIPSMDIINHDLLSKNVLYELGNFSINDAETLIARLSKRSKHYLEQDLIKRLVHDLSIQFGEVRPIELQIVCAQLESKNITTSAQYKQIGTKQELIKRYLQEVVKDCGNENQQIAEVLLYLLTDEKGLPPAKTRTELKQDFILRITDTN